MFIIIVFLFGSDKPSGFLFCARFASFYLTPLFLQSSSVSLSYFILAVPMRECLGKHSCMSSSFPIATLNCTFFFRETRCSKWSKSRLSKMNYSIIIILQYIKIIQYYDKCVFLLQGDSGSSEAWRQDTSNQTPPPRHAPPTAYPR